MSNEIQELQRELTQTRAELKLSEAKRNYLEQVCKHINDCVQNLAKVIEESINEV